jgi:hypothetical protein
MIRSLILFSLILAASAANAQEYKKMDSEYMLHSGSIGDPAPASKNDAKVSLAIKGKAAESIFSQIGPDVKDACGSESGSRFRTKGGNGVSCQYNKPDGYTCYIGIDLKRGKLVNSSVC